MEVNFSLDASTLLTVLADRTAGHGGVVWDASLMLAYSCIKEAASLLPVQKDANLRVLELGAGCGLPGIVFAASRPCRLILSDRATLIPLLEYNAGINARLFAATGSSVYCATLNFGQRLSRLPVAALPPFDVVLASDVLGCSDAGAFDALLKTLADIFSARATCTVLMTYRPRASWEVRFFEAVRERGWSLRLFKRWSYLDVSELKSRLLCQSASERDANLPGSQSIISHSDVDLSTALSCVARSEEVPGGFEETELRCDALKAHDFKQVESSDCFPGTESCLWKGSAEAQSLCLSDSELDEAVPCGLPGGVRWGSGDIELWVISPS